MKRPTYKCGQANAFFILSPRAASQLNLVQFLQAEKYEYSTASCASKQFTSLWNKAVDKGHSVVFIDYPVTEEVDVETVKKFLLHTTTEEGAWYYSPRPNSFLVVEDAFMLGVKHPKRISGINKLAMRSLLHRIYQTSQKNLPDFLSSQIRSLARKALTTFRFLSNHETSTSNQKRTPTKLAFYNACEWLEWTPERAVLYRDLLDRVSWFFPAPKGIHVIVGNRCNLKCGHCPYHSPKYRDSHTSGYFDETVNMTTSVFEKIAQYASKNNIALQFGQIEEPLTNELVFDFIRYAKDIGVPHIHLTTNGTLLNERRADRLVESGVDSVMFSIDAVTPETYKKIRGASLEKLERNIEYFAKRAKEKGIRLTASFILQEPALQERDAFLQKWKDRGFHQVTFYVLTEHDPQTGAIIRTQELYEKGDRYPCASPWTQMVLFPGGEISLCCKTMTDVGWRGIVSVGTIPEDNLDDVWAGKNGKGLYKVRKELLENRFEEYDVCVDCPIWSATTSIVEKTEKYMRTYNETMETYVF